MQRLFNPIEARSNIHIGVDQVHFPRPWGEGNVGHLYHFDLIAEPVYCAQYSSLKWNYNHFTGVDYNAADGKTSIYKIQGDGKDWAKNVDSENGN